MKTVTNYLLMCIVAIAMFVGYGCSQEFANDDMKYISSREDVARELNAVVTSDFLTVSSGDIKQWTDDDYEAVNIAVERMGVRFSKTENKYIVDATNGADINISEELYGCVITMIDNTNRRFNKATELKVPLVKNRTEIDSDTELLPDCVPAAISHMGRNAPSYETAIAQCDMVYPEWRENGGIPFNLIESLIEAYTPVTACTNISFCPFGTTNVPNLVMVFGGHAVNAYKIFNSGGQASILYYNDYSQTAGFPNSLILLSELTCIYNFD